ncbi:MAG: DUF362 domain-containing protein [Pyramidobacter sp.]|nr:DUF362 domain-containing protein [Pyramidobacter sp.]
MEQKSQVFFAPFTPSTSKVDVLKELMSVMEFGRTVSRGDLTAVKLHFGEKGNDTYLRPIFVRALADEVKKCGGKPYLCDTNTLYTGSRKNSVDHLITAIENGFGFEVTGAPLIIADGLKSNDYREVPIDGDYFKSVKIASGIAEADSLVVISHFKGHVSAGFGGALKNLAMGCAPAVGKKAQHAVALVVEESRCVGCGRCSRHCPAHAISMVQTDAGAKARIDKDPCIGCCECMTVCTSKAVRMVWSGAEDRGSFNRRLVEYAAGAVKGRKRVIYINVMMDITPLCDCCGWSDAPIVPDIGFAASTDPVALDTACYDLVTAAADLHGVSHTCSCGHGTDKFKVLHPETEPLVQMEHAEKMGMGTRQYELIKLDIKAGEGE